MAGPEAGDAARMNARIAANSKDVEAYLEKGKAEFRAEAYAASDEVLAQGEAECEAMLKAIKMWRRKCKTHLDEQKEAAAKAQAKEKKPSEEKKVQHTDTSVASSPEDPVRLEFFQAGGQMTLCFYIKGPYRLPSSTDHATVEFGEQSLKVTIKLKDHDDYVWESSQLFGKVDTAKSSFVAKSVKVEVDLVKADGAEHWERLVGEKKGVEEYAKKVASYPTSNKKAKNWAEYHVDEEEEKPEGNDALNKLFKDIYEKGDDATKKAMNKSFQESSGTVLSTNWSEVGSKEVKTTPPAGMEQRKWGS